MANRQAAAAAAAAAATTTVEKTTKEEEDEDESESSSESEESESESDSEDETNKKKPEVPATKTSPVDRTDIGPLLARSAQARDTSEQARRNSRDESGTGYGKSRYGTDSQTSSYRSPYGSKEETTPSTGSKYLNRNRGSTDDDTSSSRYGGSGSGYTSRFLNKSKSSAAMSPDEETDSGSRRFSPVGSNDDSKYPSGRSRYAALKDRRARLARSRSSHNFGGGDEDDAEDGRSSPTTSMPSSYLASRYGPGSQSSNELSRSRSTHALKSRDNSPDRTGGSSGGGTGSGTEKDGAALSSWARYLKNKYGNKAGNKEGGSSGTSTSSPSASATAARRLSLGLPLRHNSASIESSDDDQKNPGGSPTSPTAATAAAAGNLFPLCFSNCCMQTHN